MHFTTLIEENIDEEKVLKNKLTRLSKTEHSLERVFLYTKRIYESLFVPLEEAQNEIQKLRDEVKKHEIIKQVLNETLMGQIYQVLVASISSQLGK